MEHIFQVKGMTCGHCERAVQQAITQVDAQAVIQIDRAKETVVIQSLHTRDSLAHAIQEEGYSVS